MKMKNQFSSTDIITLLLWNMENKAVRLLRIGHRLIIVGT